MHKYGCWMSPDSIITMMITVWQSYDNQSINDGCFMIYLFDYMYMGVSHELIMAHTNGQLLYSILPETAAGIVIMV